jgi:lectin family protein
MILAAAIALIAAGARSANAQTTTPAAPAPVDINLDFSKTADQAKMMLNGNAAWTNGRLELVDGGGSETASAFTSTAVPATADYLATFQFEIKSIPGFGDPADGMTFTAQGEGPDQMGGGGGSIGYNGAFAPFSYAVEFNLWHDQGLQDGLDQTIAWDAFGQRLKFDQVPFPGIGDLDAGVFTAQVRVQPDQLTVTIAGGNAKLPPTVVLKSTPLDPTSIPSTVPASMPLFQALAPKPMFFGFTGATGGAESIEDVLNLHIQSPAPAVTAGE